MKRTSLLGIAVLLAPLAGCTTLNSLNPFATSSFAAAKPVPPPDAKRAAAQQTDLDGAIREAQAARKNGDLTGATKILSQLVLAAPDDARVLGEYGKTLAALGRSDDALAFLERATQLQPDEWSLLSALGVAFDQKSNYQAAQTAYARALMLKPGEPSVLNNAALSHMQSGDLDGAERLLRQAAPGTPEFPRIAQNLALVQSLKAAQPARQAILAAPVVAAPATAFAAPATAAAAPATAAAAPPAPMPAPAPTAAPQQLAAPLPPPTPVLAVALESPRQMPVDKEMSAIELLKADPTVRMQKVPKDDSAGPMPAALPAKPEAAALKTAESNAPAAKPAIGPGHAPQGSTIYVQAGSYNTEARAGEAASTLDRLGARVTSGTIEGRSVYRVRIGPFMNVQQADAAMAVARSMGRSDLRIVTEAARGG